MFSSREICQYIFIGFDMITVLKLPPTREELMDFNKIKTTLDKTRKSFEIYHFTFSTTYVLQIYLALGLTNT